MQLHNSNGEAGTTGRDHAADLSGTLYETVLLAILEGLRSALDLHIARAACTIFNRRLPLQYSALLHLNPSKYRHGTKHVVLAAFEEERALKSSKWKLPR